METHQEPETLIELSVFDSDGQEACEEAVCAVTEELEQQLRDLIESPETHERTLEEIQSEICAVFPELDIRLGHQPDSNTALHLEEF